MKKRYIMCGILILIFVGVFYGHVNAQKYNMTYLYGSGNYISMISETDNTLDEVSPSYFDVDTAGNLIINTVDMNLVNEMHTQGKKVVPFFSNHWDRESGKLALNNREKVSSDIANAVINYNLDGVNVDIENVTEKERASYTDLVRLLREKLPENKSVVVSVAANPYGWTTGWHGSYDYTSLSKYADYLMIMAYDEHYEGGEAGDVAGIEFVEKSIQYALERVDKGKIVLGIPLYGRYWKNSSSSGGAAISLEKVSELIRTRNGKVTFDEKSKSPKAEIFISAVGTRPTIYGKTLQPGTYTIWYENEESIKAKLELVNKYDIKGTGTWRLGMEEKSIWKIFKEYLSKENRIFSDVANNHWAQKAIKYMKEKQWIKGRTEELYMPENPITRGEVATIICRVLNLNPDEESTMFKDTNGHWAKGYINAISRLGIVEGYESGDFKPEQSITREEIAKILSKLSSEKAAIEESPKYKDVDRNSWSYEYIKDLSEKQILNGYEDGTFKPQKRVTRAETAKMIYEMYK